MIAARLIDNVWATRKAESLSGLKFMLAEEIGGIDEGRRFIVVDIISACLLYTSPSPRDTR